MKTNILNLMAGVLLGVITSCSTETGHQEDWTEEPSSQEHTMKLNFQANLKEFDGSPASTRTGEGWTWKDSAVVYIQYHVGTEVVHGYAVYSKTTDSWEAYWQGAIGTSDKCEVYFFEGVPTDDKHGVSFAPTQAVYADTAATYLISDSEISIQASLAPLTGRIRFAGESGQSISVKGLSYYTGYDADKNQLTYIADSIDAVVGNDGYTPYYYCLFTDTTQRQLSIGYIQDGISFEFTKQFDSSVLRVAESGYLSIPAEETNRGWSINQERIYYSFSVTGHSKFTFKMMKVEAGSFLMGSIVNDNEKPVHQVTLSKDYYMGETEVTQALWYAVMGQIPTSGGNLWTSSYGEGDNYPAYYISYEDCQQFLTKLNQLTGQQFRFPTEAEWEYAAKGGEKTNNYAYAGSNTIGYVAWYTVNSGDKTHPVAQKQANELGLYDMSGNVWEWCYDWYGSYSSSAQGRGGSWSTSYEGCRPAYRGMYYSTDVDYNLGFRLAL